MGSRSNDRGTSPRGARIGRQRTASITLQNTGQSPLEATHAFTSMGAAGELSTPRGLPAALRIGTDALVDDLSEGDVELDPNEVATAISTACAERGATNVSMTVYVNGEPVGQRTARLAQKGELVEVLAVVRSNGFFSVE